MKNITIKQLRAFLAVAKHRNFTRGAAQLNLSQSALTIAIRQLEGEIGLKLFDRSTRTVELTPHAIAFLPAAQRLLDDLGRAIEDLNAVAARESGSVVLAAAASFITYVLAPAVAVLARRFPGIRVKLVEDTTENLSRRVIEGEADIGVTTLPQPIDSLDSYLLLRDRFGVLCPKKHAIATRGRDLVWSDLRGLPIVSLVSGAGIRDILDQHEKIAAIIGRPSYEVSNTAALGSLIEREAGIGLLPALAARPITSPSLVFRAIHRPSVMRELFVIRRRGRSITPAAAEVMKLMLEELIKLTQGDDLKVVASPALLRAIQN